jgi:hypothetical protein
VPGGLFPAVVRARSLALGRQRKVTDRARSSHVRARRLARLVTTTASPFHPMSVRDGSVQWLANRVAPTKHPAARGVTPPRRDWDFPRRQLAIGGSCSCRAGAPASPRLFRSGSRARRAPWPVQWGAPSPGCARGDVRRHSALPLAAGDTTTYGMGSLCLSASARICLVVPLPTAHLIH